MSWSFCSLEGDTSIPSINMIWGQNFLLHKLWLHDWQFCSVVSENKTKPTQCLVIHTIELYWAGPETVHSFHILYSKPSSDKWFANIYSHSVCYLFIFIIVSSKHSSGFLFLAEVQFKRIPIFSLITCAFGVLYKKSLPKPGSQRFTSTYSSHSSIV